MADPQRQEPQPPKPKHPKPQTWMFSNTEYDPDEQVIRLMTIEIKPLNKLKVMSEEKNDWPYVGPWTWGLHPIYNSCEVMKEYSIKNGTWEESKEPKVDIEKMVNIHMSETMPVPRCQESRRFVENLDDIARLKLQEFCSNK